jgi:hypothetical protein
LTSSWLVKAHALIKAAGLLSASAALLHLRFILLSPLIQQYRPRPKKTPQELSLIADEEIKDKDEDLPVSEAQASCNLRHKPSFVRTGI